MVKSKSNTALLLLCQFLEFLTGPGAKTASLKLNLTLQVDLSKDYS
jgi:hypothetical protein